LRLNPSALLLPNHLLAAVFCPTTKKRQMIKENELRVGNLVYDDENIIMKVARIETKQYNYWNGDSENNVVFQTLTEANSYRESVVNPIPLTEKIVKQFGFARDENSTHPMYYIDKDRYLTIGLLVDDNDICFPFAKTNHHEAGDSFKFMGIRYVHQLQNFYYSLNYRELEFVANGS
jgi:hypothetical protein